SPDSSSTSSSPVRFFEGRKQCDRCGKHGHNSNKCWYEGQCKNCGGRHRTFLCKSRKRRDSPIRSPSSSRSPPGQRSPSRSSASALVAKSDTASDEDNKQRAHFFEKAFKDSREGKHE